MSKNEINTLESKVYDLQGELRELGPFMRGSVTMIGNKTKHPHFSVSIKGRTKLIYLGNDREATARQYSDNYQRLMEIIQEMTITNMELLKLQGQADKAAEKGK